MHKRDSKFRKPEKHGKKVEVERKNIYGNNSKVFRGEPQPLQRLHKMGDKAVKSKPIVKNRDKDQDVRQARVNLDHLDDDFMEKELVERVYKPITKASQGAYKILLEEVRKVLSDEQSSTIIDVANEVLSILKLYSLKEDQMKEQIRVFMRIEDETFRKLLSVSKNIKDFQSQTGEVQDDRKNKGTEIKLDIEEDPENNEMIVRTTEGNTGEKQLGDMQMGPDLGQEEEDLMLEISEDIGEGPSQAGFLQESRSNKTRTDRGSLKATKKLTRPDEYKQGIQSVMANKGEGLQAVMEEIQEGPEEETPNQIIFDRGESFLEKKLGSAILKTETMLKFGEILGIEDDGDCQTAMFEFIENEEALQEGLDMNLVHEVYKNREEVFFNISLKRLRDQPKQLDELIQRMKRSELGNIMLEQKTKEILDGTDILGMKDTDHHSQIGKIILRSKEMKEILEKSEMLKRKLEGVGELDNETLAGLSKNTLRLKFKVKQNTPLVGTKIRMPSGTVKMTEKGYEVVKIPAEVRKGDFGIKIKVVKEVLPQYMHQAFGDIKKLNKIQSEVFDSVYGDISNVLVCAPTGAGKTIIALLAILKTIQDHNSSDDDSSPKISSEDFKIVYIAPMKALVNEIVATLRHRLNCLGIVVSEFTGDSHLTRKEVELTQILVCTPEKWDVATRKEDHKIPEDKVKLVIIDEVHLLNDSRGPVIESLVARLKERVRGDKDRNACRLLGLSATLPNYKDVGKFLKVSDNNIFYFDGSFRPVPLSLEYIGITEGKRFKQLMLTKEILYRKVIERVKHSQILVFVHSRKDCVRTAQELKEMAFADDLLSLFVGDLTPSKQILNSQKDSFVNPDLAELSEFGIGFHHAGLERKDRNLVEDLFADKHLAVLISTATLAWGVNLPAKTVIIKNTQVYSPELGRWTELNMQDLLQMLGRAGRPFYDKEGEGIIITTGEELRMYLSLTNEQLPIESQMLACLPENLNAEISLGNITDLKTALAWMDQTYFALRLEANPAFYELKAKSFPDKQTLLKHKLNLIHSASVYLDQHGMVRYDRNRGMFESTPEGKIASEFYIKSSTLKRYSDSLTSQMDSIDLLRTFALADEFQYVSIREEELPELEKLKSSVPFPVKGSLEESSSKINILLQCYIGSVQLEGYAIAADMVFISQNAQRLFRAMFQIALKKNLGQLSLRILEFCKMIEQRMWAVQTPLRQYMDLPEKLFRRIEQQEHLTWDHLHTMSSEHLAAVIKNDKLSRKIHKFLEVFPKLEVSVYAQPVTRAQVKVQIELTQKFTWNYELHGGSLFFWVFVLDVDEENLIFVEQVCVKDRTPTLSLDFMLPLMEPLQPHYFIKVVSDNWINCSTAIPLLFTSLALPNKFPATTELESEKLMSIQQLQKFSTLSMEKDMLDAALQKASRFLYLQQIYALNYFQSNLLDPMWNSYESVFLGANPNSGKFTLALLSLVKFAENDINRQSRILLVFSDQISLAKKLAQVQVLSNVLECGYYQLTGKVAKDVKAFSKKDNFLILTTAANLDKFTKNPKKRAKQLKLIKVMIVSDLQNFNLENGGLYETTLIRMRFILFKLELRVRVIGLACSVANYLDLADFLGVEQEMSFNVHPSVLNNFINLLFYSFQAVDETPRFMSMAKQFYRMLKINSFQRKSSVAYVDSLRASKILLSSLIKHLAKDKISLATEDNRLNHLKDSVSDVYLKFFLENRCAYLHSHQDKTIQSHIIELFEKGILKVLVITKGLFRQVVFQRKVDISFTFDSDHLTLMDHLTILGKNNRIQYPAKVLHSLQESINKENELGQQISELRLSETLCETLLKGQNLKSIIFSKSSKKDFLKRSLFEPLAVESRILENLTEALNSEIVSKVVSNKQEGLDWVTWSFFYRRISANPNYYNLASRTTDEVSEFLSEVIENSVEDLENNSCLIVHNEMDLEADNLGIIGSYYGTKIESMGLFSNAVQKGVTWQKLIQVFASASEFKTEDIQTLCAINLEVTQQIYPQVRYKFFDPNSEESSISFQSTETCNNILLQRILARDTIPKEFQYHSGNLVTQAFNLIQSFIDTSNTWQLLRPALLAMKFNQMLVQSLWFDDSNLLQLPHVDTAILSKWKTFNVTNLDDFFELEDKDREKALRGLTQPQVEEIAEYANRYPSVVLEATLDPNHNTIKVGDSVDIKLNVERDNLDEEDLTLSSVKTVNNLIQEKSEFWWVVIGDKARNLLLAVKKVQFLHTMEKTFSVDLEKEGKYNLSVFLICDSYLGCDNEVQDLIVQVKPSELDEEK